MAEIDGHLNLSFMDSTFLVSFFRALRLRPFSFIYHFNVLTVIDISLVIG